MSLACTCYPSRLRAARTLCLIAIAWSHIVSAGMPDDGAASAKLDVGYVPTPPAAVQKMLEMAQVGPSDYLVDLGSGDGRIVIAAVRDHDAGRALGVDLDPWWQAAATRRARSAGVEERATFVHGDVFEYDFSAATVLTMYLLPALNLRLRPLILDRMAPGTRIVSNSFDTGEWRPDRKDEVAGRSLFLWVVPASVAGDWIVMRPNEPALHRTLEQAFQDVEGRVTGGGEPEILGEIDLAGANIRFSLGARHYSGVVDGDVIDATEADEWRAHRVREPTTRGPFPASAKGMTRKGENGGSCG